jgi:hypothetical protein
MIIQSIKWMCEGSFQATEIERVWISAIWQGAVWVVYNNAFWSETCDWTRDNWESYVFMWWNENTWQVHILWWQ